MSLPVYNTYSSAVKTIRGNVETIDASDVAAAVSSISGAYIESPTIYGGTMDNTVIGGNTAADAHFLSLQTGSPGIGYDATFYGANNTSTVWDSAHGTLDVTGGLSVTGTSDLGNISIGGNALQANVLNGNISILANGTGYVGLDRFPHLIVTNEDHDAGWLVEWPDSDHATRLGFFGVRPDGAFTWIPGATVAPDGLGRRAVTGDAGEMACAALETTRLMLPQAAPPGSMIAVDRMRIDDALDASGASTVTFADGQLFGSWVAGGTVAADVSGNAATVTNGIYSTDFSSNSILKADQAGMPYPLQIPEGTVVGRLPGGQVSAIPFTDLGGGGCDYIAHSILKADAAGAPVSLVILPDTVVGRVGTGDIVCLNGSAVLSLQQVDGALPSDIRGNATTVTNGLYRSDYDQTNCILKADAVGNPVSLQLPENTIVGRTGDGEISALDRDHIRRFLDGTPSSFDTIVVEDDTTVLSVVTSTTRVTVASSSTSVICALPDGPYDGFRKTILIVGLDGTTLTVTGRVFLPETVPAVFTRDYESRTLEWVDATRQWICITNEQPRDVDPTAPSQDDIPDAGSYRLLLSDNMSGFVAFVPLVAPNGSYAIMVSDVVSGGATACFLVSGSVAAGGNMVRTSGMPGGQNERLQMVWSPGSMPALSYSRLPDAGTGSIMTYNAVVMGTGTAPSSASPTATQPVQFSQITQNVTMIPNQPNYAVPLSNLPLTGAYFISASAPNGAQACFSVSGTWASGGSVQTLSQVCGSTSSGELLRMQWLPGSYPCLSYTRSGATETVYTVRAWGSGNVSTSANKIARITRVSISTSTPSVEFLTTLPAALPAFVFVSDASASDGPKAVFQMNGSHITVMCRCTGGSGEVARIDYSTGRPRLTVDNMQPDATYQFKVVVI